MDNDEQQNLSNEKKEQKSENPTEPPSAPPSGATHEENNRHADEPPSQISVTALSEGGNRNTVEPPSGLENGDLAEVGLSDKKNGAVDAVISEPPPAKAAEKDKGRPPKKKKRKSKKKRKNDWLIWGVSVFFLSFVLTVVFSFLTEVSVKDSPSYVCVIVLLVLLILNIGCDVLANAIISVNPEAFHAMASNKIKGAKRAVSFCRNATKLSSIFADVIGDICGIVSGAAGTALVVHIAVLGTTAELIASIGISAVIGALTVGGKAIFKHFAVKYNKQIVFGFAKFTTVFKKER